MLKKRGASISLEKRIERTSLRYLEQNIHAFTFSLSFIRNDLSSKMSNTRYVTRFFECNKKDLLKFIRYLRIT